MSATGRPERECRSAQHEASPVSAGHFVAARRSALRAAFAAVAAVICVTSVPASAQDPRNSAVQGVARSWLALTDRLDAAAAWQAAGAKFRQRLPANRWAAALAAQRKPLGALVQRAVTATRFTPAPQGMPAGEYAVVQFRASFANRTGADETVTLEHEADGAWRVVGYTIG
jgi:hypothetical protein